MKQFNRNYTYEEVLEKIKKYITEESELEKFEKAYRLSEVCYANNYRMNGTRQLDHALAVSYILTSVYSDIDTLCAGLLHEAKLEEWEEELKKKLDTSVIKLIAGVNKISKLHFSTENEYLIEYYKKIIVGMSEDVRVIIIKLASRLHNMRTLYALDEERQKKKAKETLEIFAPIAHHLGIHKIKSELEDLSLRYLKPDVFYDIVERLNKTKVERDQAVSEMMMEVSSLLNEHNIKHEIKGRAKSIYSIYNKLNNGKKFNDIYDLLALRVLVDSEQECYLAIGLVHSKFKPVPKRFKDYVAMPKANMYQSLHTTVFGINGFLFEIQIRTYQMDEIAENGIASHWAYKEKKDVNPKNMTEQKLQFFKSIIDLNADKMISGEDFVNSFKEEISNDSIYCFTPKGDVIELPRGATPIDFAYKVHTRVGETMVGALVNDAIVPLDYELQDNDIVKINTNKNSKGPSKEWLNLVKCTQTKNKIRAFFTKNEREIYVERGKDALEKELRKRKIPFSEFFQSEIINQLIKEYKQENLEELYLHIGNGKYNANSVINEIYKKEEDVVPLKKTTFKNNDNDIIVDGIDKVKVNIASCCSPLPGDSIVGYITKGNGISIHRSCCRNLEILENRTVPVRFNEQTKDRYTAPVIIYTTSNENKMLEMIKKLSGFDLNIDNFNVISKNDVLVYEVDFIVKNFDQLEKIEKELEKLEYVTKIERVTR